MEALVWILTAALVFGVCRLVDIGFQKLFRNKAEHLSGKAVRVNKRYGVFGVILSAVGIAAIVTGFKGTGDQVLLWGGVIVFLLGVSLAVYYLGFGIFYGEDTFLVSTLFKKSASYPYSAIVSQKLYLITGGNIVVELQLENGKTVSLQSTMEGVYPFLDTAFQRWCAQKGLDPDSCDFHDPQKSWWFPHEEA
ncbi:hypothetical protein KQI10_03745 [Pseudoflavonifractor sp. MSJ-30]|uniref:hypothetical protein n=1 Tax=Pseudoflavonifractor sp. MSJ-30 TaxID=2841525 RepID=UPI001C0F6F1B|nr:hypothetical protein [Pseudoflavonifractor sp. MSJ-30]MBU5452286.1 hypothetical protein [Pseudoflavonifractor sp. MSJ-30]